MVIILVVRKTWEVEKHMKKKHNAQIMMALILLLLSFCISYKYVLYKEKNSKDGDGKNSIEERNEPVQNAKDADSDDKSSYVNGKADNYVENYVVYNVKKGDCLSKICKENIVGYTLSKAKLLIIKKNNLKSERDIKEGMKLLITQKCTDGWIEYIVQPGDSLYSIAEKFFGTADIQIFINEIRQKNSMDSDEEPEADQRLLIPDRCK